MQTIGQKHKNESQKSIFDKNTNLYLLDSTIPFNSPSTSCYSLLRITNINLLVWEKEQ